MQRIRNQTMIEVDKCKSFGRLSHQLQNLIYKGPNQVVTHLCNTIFYNLA